MIVIFLVDDGIKNKPGGKAKSDVTTSVVAEPSVAIA
jgi:hypothetical protein